MKRKTLHRTEDCSIVLAPLNDSLSPQKRMEATMELSELVMRMATYLICYTLVYNQEQLKEERKSIAHAFLQRVMTMHLANHKMTKEGLVYEYKGEPFVLHEQYKTLTLTRSVYEHLAMFYFLFEHPQTDEERNTLWRNWKSGRKAGIIPYNQAWKYLFNNEEMASFYRNLSIHCHPAYKGLLQYQYQGTSDQGNDSLPLYFSCRFLAHLCRLFTKQIPDGLAILRDEFTAHEMALFRSLSQMPED